MPTNTTRAGRAALLLLAALVTIVSCSRQLQRLASPNQPPEVRIVSSDFLAGSTTDAVHTVVRWLGSDPEGRVDHYLVAVNPRSLDAPDATWVRTTETEWVASGVPGQPVVVAVRAVDASGAQSTTASHAFVDDDHSAVGGRPVVAPRDRNLLIVDDTRFAADRFRSGELQRPLGRWPTAAELDTFLYARGGYPWQGYPEGTTSSPGLLAGYDFDTIGTRIGRVDLTVPLETLLRYRHVVWITDGKGATNNRIGTDGTQPQTALRYMTSSGRTNTLASYVTLGGKVWVVGGGVGYAACISNNDLANDRPTTTFRSGDPRYNELGPGRFMWDLVHWRSAFRVANDPVSTFERVAPSTRGGTPRYSRMPVSFDFKTPATDPLPPLRVASDFYIRNFDVEFLIEPNDVLEPPGRGHTEHLVSVLDTLYVAHGVTLGPEPVPVVTYYHGHEHPPVLFSGMDLWSYRRNQCQQMVDAVLQDLWHLSPASGPEPIRRGGRPALSASGNPTRASRPAATTARDRYRVKR